jgi:hypothetical protein
MAQFLQDAHHGDTHLRVKQVNEARYEKRYLHALESSPREMSLWLPSELKAPKKRPAKV